MQDKNELWTYVLFTVQCNYPLQNWDGKVMNVPVSLIICDKPAVVSYCYTA